jgi:hypothetical protein
MNAMALLLVLTTPGIEYGWNPGPDGQLEYVIQLEPQALDALRSGKEISSDIHPDVRSVRRFVLKVGEGPVPRIAIAPEALEEDSESEDGQASVPQTQQPRAGTKAGRNDRNATEGQRPATNRNGAARNPSSPGSGRTAPPLLPNRAQSVGASISSDDSSETDETFDENPDDADGRFTVADDATEDGAGPYDRVRSPSRYSVLEDGDEQDRGTENDDISPAMNANCLNGNQFAINFKQLTAAKAAPIPVINRPIPATNNVSAHEKIKLPSAHILIAIVVVLLGPNRSKRRPAGICKRR